MKPRFLADANLNRKIIAGLRRRDPKINFQTAEEGGILRQSDPEVLLIAAGQGRILVSHDRRTMPAGFARFIETRASPGLIVVSQELDVGVAIDDLLLISTATTHEEWENTIGFVPI